ncbi:MAG: hypothetical protein ACK5QX_07775 [bacterium]
MISAILSFLGGSAFRLVWGEVAAWLNRRQEHAQELDRLRLQGDMDAAQHARNMESIRVQAELGVKTIEVKAEAESARIETEAWLDAVRATGRSVGVKWVDAWNASIRPGVATWALAMLSAEAAALVALSDGAASVCYAALGLYLADRALAKRGK